MNAFETMQQFKAYVAEQPQDKPINHSSWRSCALGEFARDVLNDQDDPYIFKPTTAFNTVFGSQAYDVLGNGGWSFGITVPMNTYGELSTWLESLPMRK